MPWRVVLEMGLTPVSLSGHEFSSLSSPEVALNPPYFLRNPQNPRKEEKLTKSNIPFLRNTFLRDFSTLSEKAFLQA